MEKIKEAITLIDFVIKSMPECSNKTFLIEALKQLNQVLIKNDIDMIKFKEWNRKQNKK
jgi:hypothetical protein